MTFTLSENKPFEWSRMDCVVVGLTFEQLMIKLQHADRSWRDGLGRLAGESTIEGD